MFIAPSARLAETFSEAAQEQGKRIPVIVGELDEGVSRARELMKDGIDVIISRGGTSLAIKRYIEDIPVVDVPVTILDVFRALEEAREHTDKVLVSGFRPFTAGIARWGHLFGIHFEILCLEDTIYSEPAVVIEEFKRHNNKGYQWVVGDTFSVKVAQSLGMNSVLIDSGREAVLQAIAEAERVAMVRRTEMERTQRIKFITDYAYEGIVGIDERGIVSIFNPSAEKILSLAADRIIGRPVREVLPAMELERNLESGERELGKVVTVGEVKIAANVVPIRVGGDVMRVVATFQNVSGIQKIEEKIRRNLAMTGLTADHSFKDILGTTSTLRRLCKEAEEYAQFDLPVFLYGDTGTGKELFAQAIHNASPRCGKAFVAFNCSALPESLLESELFGYTAGAFTGASKGGKPGIFELAHGGTLFLDEIGEISPDTQVKLLRVIEERKIRRLGDDRFTPVDVRIVAATNKNLKRLIEENRFRQDLFYRLNVLVLNLPPLRERKQDIPLLCEWFVRKYGLMFGKEVTEIAPKGLELLQRCSWPGNVRQLENVAERMVIKCKGSRIGLSIVLESLQAEEGCPPFAQLTESATEPTADSLISEAVVPLNISLAEMEKFLIEKVVGELEGNRIAAAARLGIGRTTLWRKLRE